MTIFEKQKLVITILYQIFIYRRGKYFFSFLVFVVTIDIKVINYIKLCRKYLKLSIIPPYPHKLQILNCRLC